MPHALIVHPHAVIVRAAEWIQDESGIAALRRQVFIEEQGVPEALEWEEVDAFCRWFVALTQDQQVIGIVRLIDSGQRESVCKIGRMAVRPDWRRCGVGGALLDAVLKVARDDGFARVELSAQTHAIEFYAGRGFVAEGPEYQDAGIAHRSMSLALQDIS